MKYAIMLLLVLALPVKANDATVRAAQLALIRSHEHSRAECWGYVKDALVMAGVVKSRPPGIWAIGAVEVLKERGWHDSPLRDGCILVYKDSVLPYGHVEFYYKGKYVSDYHSDNPPKRSRFTQIACLDL